MSYLIPLHLLSAVIWVGGMFFAYMALRPAAGSLEPPFRLKLWRDVFARFFPWVGVAVVVLVVTGYMMIETAFGGFAGAPPHVHVMQATGWLMIVLFGWLLMSPHRALRKALDANDIPAGARALARIRHIIAVNLALGIVTIVLGASGRYWG